MQIRHWLEQHGRQVLIGAGLALVAFYILRGCIPALQGHGGMPNELYNRITSRYVTCIDAYNIRPGDRRQPDCGQAFIEVVGKGIVPEDQLAAGVTKALCYRISIDNPYISTIGSATAHDEFWKSRAASKVTVRQNGEWQIFPDLEPEDVARWTEYGCPGSYEEGKE
jgi:hypothetical protein